jgi:hypothetical protein
MAALDRILARTGGVTLVIVDDGEPAPKVARYLALHPPPRGATLVVDRDGTLFRRFGARRLPTTFLLDGTGVIRHINRGYGPGYPRRLDAWVAQLQSEPHP